MLESIDNTIYLYRLYCLYIYIGVKKLFVIDCEI